MIAVDEVFSFVSFVVNKNLNGAFTPKGFNNAIKAANIELFDELRGGRFSSYQPGRPVPVIGMEENQTLSDELDPFVVADIIAVASGIATIPADLIQTLAIRNADNNVPLSWVKKGDLADYLISEIDYPQADVNPIYTNVGGAWEIYPNTITSVKAYYLRMPVTPKYDYTVTGGGITFNSGTSVNFEWKPTAFMALCAKVLYHLGINLSNDQVVGYADKLKMEVK
jgi:hypothetical protein